jgi:hypothetical protein
LLLLTELLLFCACALAVYAGAVALNALAVVAVCDQCFALVVFRPGM